MLTGDAPIEVCMELTLGDSGGRRLVRVGDHLTVVLSENPTTGYRWQAAIDTAALQQTADRFDGPTQPRGGAGTRRLTFTVLRPGSASLRLVKRRSWDATVVGEFDLEVEAEAR